MVSKEQIVKKVDILLRQFEKCGGNVYIPHIEKAIMNFFSDQIELQNKALQSIQGFTKVRIWEDFGIGFGIENPKYPTYYKDNYVDNFNNFGEWYEFLQGLVKDVEEYHKERLSSQS